MTGNTGERQISLPIKGTCHCGAVAFENVRAAQTRGEMQLLHLPVPRNGLGPWHDRDHQDHRKDGCDDKVCLGGQAAGVSLL